MLLFLRQTYEFSPQTMAVEGFLRDLRLDTAREVLFETIIMPPLDVPSFFPF